MNQAQIQNPSEGIEAGRVLRKDVRRRVHGSFQRAKETPGVVAILASANRGRLPHLLPLKMSRMSVSPFSFFRGAAPVMAADLSRLPVSGLNVQICGDAHVRNLGAYATPEGELVFDLNDFDETVRGPWEWDLKRLSSSIVLAGREAGATDVLCAEGVRAMVRAYRAALYVYCRMPVAEMARFEIRQENAPGALKAILRKAERATAVHLLARLTSGGKAEVPRFHDQPPVLQHVPPKIAAAVLRSLRPYRETLGAGRQMIFDAYRAVDVAFKVVGTGSVGTRDYVVLLFGHGRRDPIFMQIKEALESCYQPYLSSACPIKHHGQRVAQGQQRVQTVSDPFLGWTTIDGRPYLVRQLADHKAALDVTALRRGLLVGYSGVCGEILAKAHARTGPGAMLAGYCGRSERLDRAIADFALSYADQTERDFVTFRKAARAGKLSVH